MSVPNSGEARLYYRCAYQRFEDAQILLGADHTTGAVYLAGYGVECMLKALVLASLVPPALGVMLGSFRGPKAHDFEWLRLQYYQNGGARFPREINQAFTLVSDWSTDLRYVPRSIKLDEAKGFLDASDQILTWANGRL
jgi:hypothetical protein